MSYLKKYIKYLIQVYIIRTRYSYRRRKKFGYYGKNTQLVYSKKCKNIDRIFIGDNTTILEGSRIQIYSNSSKVEIGKNCFLGYNLSILSYKNVNIGDDVLIASNVLITSENHGLNPESNLSYMQQELTGADVNIKNGCWIGEKVMILSGVTIGEKSIIGAGSVVTKDIPDYSIAAGNPAKVIKKYNFTNHKWERI